MAADVGYMVYALNDTRRTRLYDNGSDSEQCTDLITRDLIGESFSGISSNDSSQELVVHLQATTGWPENCLDLIKSGKGYLQKCNGSGPNQSAKKPIKRQLDNTNLDLKSPSNIHSSTYKSVCTLDKVKSALDREKHEVTLKLKTTSMSSSLSSQDEGSLKLSAAGCSNCLMYVMISNEDPKCPKCDSTVSLPVTKKKPRIDLDLNLYL